MKKKKNIKQIYSEMLNYIYESRKFFLFLIIIFIFFAFIGFVLPSHGLLSQKIQEILQELIEKTKDMNFLELSLFILLNNLKVSFIGLISGIFFGIIPVIIGVANGYLLGFVSSMVVKEETFFSLWKLFPHGIFELSAVFISLGLGLKLGLFYFQKNKKDYIKENLLKSLRIFFLIVLPLLILASLIETTFIFLLG